MKKLFVTVVAMMLLLAPGILAQYAQPGAPETVEGGASIVEGAGTDPVIEYIWVLPDDDNLTPDTQLDIVPSGERNDIYACLVVSDAESRDSIVDVFVDLYHPDASFKYQMHATRLEVGDVNIPDDADEAEIEACKDDALAAGLINLADHEDIDYNIFSQPNWYMYKVWLPMWYHQPAGLYEARGFAVDSTSRLSDPVPDFFEWLAGTYLELDFIDVTFGSIQPGAWKILNGDLDMATPDAPTLKNEGNTEILVGVEFTEFTGTDDHPNKVIDQFDAQLRNLGTNNYLEIPGEHLEFLAEELVWFTYPISLCRQEKIDFSIHADIGTVPDNYDGDVTIYADPVLVDAPPPDVLYPHCDGSYPHEDCLPQ